MDRRARRYAFAAVALLGATIGLWAYIRYSGPLPYELRVARWERTHHDLPKWLIDTCQLFSSVGEPAPAVGITALLAFGAADIRGRRAGAFVLAAAAVVLLTTVLKDLLDPSKLAVEIGRRYHYPIDGYYPSGHTAYATAIFGACVVLAKYAGHRALGACFAVAIVLMGVTRVIAGAHYPSDVIGGYLIGTAWLCMLLALAPGRTPAGRSDPGGRPALAE